MNRRISSLVNFVINFGVLFAALFIGANDTNLITTILFATSGGIIILNAIFISMRFSRNLGQFVSRTKYVRGDRSNPCSSTVSSPTRPVFWHLLASFLSQPNSRN